MINWQECLDDVTGHEYKLSNNSNKACGGTLS